jgi:hypothetical protein
MLFCEYGVEVVIEDGHVVDHPLPGFFETVARPVERPDGYVRVGPVVVEELDVVGAGGSVCEADECEAGCVEDGWWRMHFGLMVREDGALIEAVWIWDLKEKVPVMYSRRFSRSLYNDESESAVFL